LKMAQPIGIKACLISLVSAYSVENGASNRDEVLFKNRVS
jgi:hypothetical protein